MLPAEHSSRWIMFHQSGPSTPENGPSTDRAAVVKKGLQDSCLTRLGPFLSSQEEIFPVFCTVCCLYIWWSASDEQESEVRTAEAACALVTDSCSLQVGCVLSLSHPFRRRKEARRLTLCLTL